MHVGAISVDNISKVGEDAEVSYDKAHGKKADNHFSISYNELQ